MVSKLSTREAKLLEVLRDQNEVPINDLYPIIRGDGDDPRIINRTKQQRLGSVISELNKKLVKSNSGYKIKPGSARRTYRITPA